MRILRSLARLPAWKLFGITIVIATVIFYVMAQTRIQAPPQPAVKHATPTRVVYKIADLSRASPSKQIYFYQGRYG